MKHLYDKISEHSSKHITKKYSTSFSLAVKLLSPEIRHHIYNIYGFVRIADEIVDSFHDYPQEALFDAFEADYYQSLETGISVNPVINAFQNTLKKFNIDTGLVKAFLKSMRADLNKSNYLNQDELDEYIYGSADVVGLMCLKIFVNGDQEEYLKLRASAMRLGSAFQKVNFLRDLKDDTEVLNRSYFPHLDLNQINASQKKQIIEEIREDFEAAWVGVRQLPPSSKKGVYVAYRYYYKLFKKLENTTPELILQRRIRVNNFSKFMVLIDSNIRLHLNTV